MIKWFRDKMIWLMLALQKTEANVMNSEDDGLLTSSGKYQSHKQGMLSQSLVNGELTQEVKELRWRIYKIVQHTQGVRSEIIGYDEDDQPIVNTMRETVRPIKNFNGDPTDDYPIKMVVSNRKIDVGTTQAMDKLTKDEDITFNNYLTQFKHTKTLFIKRELRPMFEIEKYTNRMVVKDIRENDKLLLEFYVNKYPDMEDRRSRFFLSEVNKIKNGKHNSSLTDFEGVLFISDKTPGVKDYLEFEFAIDKFFKITEYDGNYIIKFIADKVVYGDDVLDKYKIDSLETKYENKERK